VITLNPGGSHSADSTLLDGDDGDDQYFIHTIRLNGGAEAATIEDTGGGNDRATVYATDAAEQIHVDNNVADQSARRRAALWTTRRRAGSCGIRGRWSI
jgi:hypothetical protein